SFFVFPTYRTRNGCFVSEAKSEAADSASDRIAASHGSRLIVVLPGKRDEGLRTIISRRRQQCHVPHWSCVVWLAVIGADQTSVKLGWRRFDGLARFAGAWAASGPSMPTGMRGRRSRSSRAPKI